MSTPMFSSRSTSDSSLSACSASCCRSTWSATDGLSPRSSGRERTRRKYSSKSTAQTFPRPLSKEQRMEIGRSCTKKQNTDRLKKSETRDWQWEGSQRSFLSWKREGNTRRKERKTGKDFSLSQKKVEFLRVVFPPPNRPNVTASC